jgi:hypothetical protein
MTTETMTNPVATLKAEIVTEFVFEPEYSSRRYGSKDVVAPYRSDYRATVGVRVGNTVKEITFRTLSKYMSSYQNENGHWDSRNDLEYMAMDERVNPFEELENVGIAIDYMDVLVQYQEAVEVAKYRMTLHTRYRNWETIRRNKKEYANSWMHEVVHTLKADKNKRIQTALKNTTFEVKSLEKFLSHASHAVTVTYKGVTGSIFMENGGYTFDGESTYKFPKDYDGQNSYNHRFTIADGKKRRAKRLGTLYLKFVEEVDYELNQREARANRKKSEAEQRAEKKARLSEIAGYPLVILKSEKYNRDHRGYRTESYYEYTYFILTKQPETSYGSPEGFSIDEHIERVYIGDGKHKNVGVNYSIKNLNNLSETQLKSILDILMEGKTALTKLEIPN